MFRISLIIVMLFTSNMSWALDWNICHKDLKSLRKMSPTENNVSKMAIVSNLSTASNLAVKLRDLYEDIQTQRFAHERCKNSINGTLYCVDIQGKMNAMLFDYQADRGNFNNLMASSGKFTQSKKEACGFKLD